MRHTPLEFPVIFHGVDINIFKKLTLFEEHKTATNCSLVNIMTCCLYWSEVWRHSGFVISVLVSGPSRVALSPGQQASSCTSKLCAGVSPIFDLYPTPDVSRIEHYLRFKFLMISITKCPHWLKVT